MFGVLTNSRASWPHREGHRRRQGAWDRPQGLGKDMALLALEVISEHNGQAWQVPLVWIGVVPIFLNLDCGLLQWICPWLNMAVDGFIFHPLDWPWLNMAVDGFNFHPLDFHCFHWISTLPIWISIG